MKRLVSGAWSEFAGRRWAGVLLSGIALIGLCAGLRAASPSVSVNPLADGRVTLSWPVTPESYVVEQVDVLRTIALWAAVSETPVPANGRWSVTLPASVRERFFRLRSVDTGLLTVVSTVPVDGEGTVSVRHEVLFVLSSPLSPETVMDTNHLYAVAAGRRLLTRADLSPDRTRATLFFLEDLPGGTRVSVTMDGAGLLDASGRPVDLDGDRVPGGSRVLNFITFNSAPLPATAVVGRVLKSEKDAGGAEVPIPGVKITVDGLEDDPKMTFFTGADGRFRVEPAPAGRFFVNVDGRTSPLSQWPDGAYYPVIGKAWFAEPGRTNNLAGGTGLIYLPRVASGTLQPVSATEETRVTFPTSVIAQNPALAGVEIVVPPNALYSDDGKRGGLIGLAPVASDRLPEPLPEGLNHAIDISIQSSGPQNFDTPVPAKFPNLPDPVTGEKLPPGAKTALWSFNHDSGRWELQGSMTISDDGDFAVTDPGVGIRQPGWHGVSNATPADGGPPTGGNCPDNGGTGGLLEEGTFSGGGGNCDCKEEPSDNLREIRLCDARAAACALACYKDCGTPERPEDWVDVLSKGKDCAEAARCSQQCREDGERCKEHWMKCFLHLGNGVSSSQGRRARSAELESDPVLALVQEINADLSAQAQLWFILEALLNKADRFEDLSPADQTRVLEVNQELNAAYGGKSPSAYSALRQRQLVERVLASADADLMYPPVQGWYVLTDLETGLVRRGRTETRGYVTGLILRPNTQYRIRLLVGPRLTYHDAVFTSASAGVPTRIEFGNPKPIPAGDTDGDGVPTEAEFILGTRDDRADSDQDGISDLQELINRSNPADGLPTSPGIIASVDTPGDARDVAVGDSMALVADGPAGVAVVNLSDPRRPTLLTRIPGSGEANGVAVEGRFGAVAFGSGGVAVLDLSDPAAPQISATVSLPGITRTVLIRDARVYAGTASGGIFQIEAATGTVVNSLSIPGASPVSDLAILDGYLYAWANAVLHVVALSEDGMKWQSAINTGARFPDIEPVRRRLAAAGGKLYGTTLEGVAVFDLADPAVPVLAKLNVTTIAGWKHLVPVMGTLAVAADGIGFNNSEPHDISLYDLGEDGTGLQFLASFPTPGMSKAVTLYGGYAVLADGLAGVEVVQLTVPDTAGIAPTVTLQTDFPGGGAEIESGQPGRLVALANDDVFVRSVEFYLDGVRVAADSTWPYEYRFTAPERTATVTAVRLGARAVDTAGNTSPLVEITVPLLPDQTPPRVVGFAPTANSTVESVSSVVARFNEPLDPGSLSPAAIYLMSAGPDLELGTLDDALITGTLSYSAAAQAILLQVSSPLANGRYRWTVGGVRDRVGNSMGAAVSSTFWVAPGGDSGDADGDGLTNSEESSAQTNPFSEDTDGDGWADEVEVHEGTNPRDPESHPTLLVLAVPGVSGGIQDPLEVLGEHAGPILAVPPVAFQVMDASELANSGPFLSIPPIQGNLAPIEEQELPGPWVASPRVQLGLVPVDELASPGPWKGNPTVSVRIP
ncbi:MAG: Ig-like domain-containing protein [Verrucomicrobiota bacterium]